MHSTAGGSWRILVAVLAMVMLQGCERISPVGRDPALGADAVVLTCESCHTTRSYLRRLALEEESGGGGGGG
jgi:hypothetical protein